MRLTLIVLLAVLTVGIGVPAFAELQTTSVGGELRMRGGWYNDPDLTFDENAPGNDFFFEQRTLLNVTADFTDDVTAFFELDNYNFFGEPGEFRGFDINGDTMTGDDVRGSGNVALYQAYIEMREAWGYPLTFRIGRQEVQLGSEWLVGNNDTGSLFRGLSFDGVMASYGADEFSVSAYWLRLAELGGIPDSNGQRENAEDADLYIVYGSYTGIEDVTIDAYWMWVRAARLRGTMAPLLQESDSGSLHTIGARAAGTYNQIDYEIEGAYQFGDPIPGTIDALNAGVAVYALAAGADLDVSAFAVHGEVGYTFDMEYQPRVYVAGAYYDGGDDFGSSTGNPQDLSFNRLFSDHEYSEFIGNTDLSNFWVISGGASAQVTEELEVGGVVSYFQAVEDWGTSDDALGFEVGVNGTYAYSEDLSFQVGYSHFFVGDGIQDGAAVSGNGTRLLGGSTPPQDDDLDHVYFETRIRF